ncbi:hypothetical protein HID58_095315 [Brassica napus]|uniref:Uncharacterized protein n=1 Tax=Brassica napus TaxID=3708 RepID=A0ABQ7X431_BRANA|nr:hypothetical protein HID58_095315 [Brassica napus]
MSVPVSAMVFSENNVRVAEEQYRRGNPKGALEVLHALTFVFPNTSTNHPRRQYMNIVAKLCPEKNKSVAAKLAFKIINATWMVLYGPEGSGVHNIEQELGVMFQEDELPHQSVREGKRPCVGIIDTDSDSDSD